MTLSISFYNGIKYTKDDFIKRDQDFFGNGVVKTEHFPYTLASTPDMTIQIGTGVAWVDGYRIENDAPITFTLQPPGDQPRIDIVQIGHDDFHACAVLEVKTGVPGHTESIPAADPKFVELYAIYVNPGVAGIAAEDVVKVAPLVPLQVSGAQISFDGAVPSSEKGQPDGVATLDSMGKVLVGQIPGLDYVSASEKANPNGVATLDKTGVVPLTQLPPLNFVPTSAEGQPNGVASLDSTGKVPVGQIPELDYVHTVEKGKANGVATLDNTGVVPQAQLPLLNFVPTSAEGQPNGVASLDATGKVPVGQIPTLGYVPNSAEGQPNGVAQLDPDGKVPTAQLPIATATAVGAVYQGTNVVIGADGKVSVTSFPWSGIMSAPTTLGGYGITDAVKKTGDSMTGTLGLVEGSTLAGRDSVPNYDQFMSGADSNGIYTVLQLKRTDGTMYMKSTLSNPDTNGNYQTDTWQFYDSTGTNLIKTQVWSITWDSNNKATKKVMTSWG